MKRTRLTRGPGPNRTGDLARTARLRPMSARRRAENRQRAQVVAKLAADVEPSDRCPAAEAFPDVACGGPVDPHEPLSRARGGAIVDPANIRLICRNHHTHIHGDPLKSKRVGWLKSRWDAQ